MAENNLNAEDICKIIECCAKNGIVFASVYGIDLDFGKKVEKSFTFPVVENDPDAHEIVQKMQERELEALKEDEFNEKLVELQNLALTDPLAYEEALKDGLIANEINS